MAGDGDRALDRSPLTQEDLVALNRVRQGSEWLRAVSCTLARRGAAFRQHSERAEAILEALSTHPLYKMGQFLFDLTEWEDFMLDGPAPPIVTTTLDSRALRRLAELLRDIKAHLDGAVEAEPETSESLTVLSLADADLPALEASSYLYQDVVLGIIQSIGPQVAAGEAVQAVED